MGPTCVRAQIVVAMVALMLGGCVTRTPAPVVDRAPPPVSPGSPALSSPPQYPSPPVAVTVPPPPAPAQPDWRPEFYTIKRGDTLFAIALEHGLDYRELAAMNNIENINVIRVGQVLRVRVPGEQGPSSAGAAGPSTAPLVTVPPVSDGRPVADGRPPAAARIDRANSDAYKTQPKAVKLPYSEAALAQLQSQSGSSSRGEAVAPPVVVAGSPVTTAAGVAAAGSAPTTQPIGPLASAAPSSGGVPPTPSAPGVAGETGEDSVDWGWPVKGRIISQYSETASLKGIDIGGAKGVPIVATAPGRVVYAGSGLRGYGKLVIVKHNKTYLSAYAHLDVISIREGQTVTKGQEIGKMGNSDADQVKLHFEIRSLGKPVDPMRYLPRG